MADIFTKEKRSQVMSQIRSHGNKGTELRLIALMRKWHITGWRRNYPLFGRPDFVFPRERLAVFVDGCFWHGCPKHGTQPASNKEFWEDKLRTNKSRDKEVIRILRQKGWRVLRIWEHDLRLQNEKRLCAKIRRHFLR